MPKRRRKKSPPVRPVKTLSSGQVANQTRKISTAWKKIPFLFWTLIASGSTLLAYTVLPPKISIEASGRTGDQSAWPDSFTLVNESLYRLYDFQITFKTCYLRFDLGRIISSGPREDCNFPIAGGFSACGWTYKVIDPDQPFAISLEDAINTTKVADQLTTKYQGCSTAVIGDQPLLAFDLPAKLLEGDVQIGVSFSRPIFWPFKNSIAFRFITRIDNNGNMVWVPTPFES